MYNGEQYLTQAIGSCLQQTYKNIELIIVNDCSTDATLSIAKSFADNDSRVKVITNEINKRLPASLNIGHNIAKGEFLTWTSDDNLYLKLKKKMFQTRGQLNWSIIADEWIKKYF